MASGSFTKVLYAAYGCTTCTPVDVTNACQTLVAASSTNPPSFDVTLANLGIADPAPHVVKTLIVVYSNHRSANPITYFSATAVDAMTITLL